MVAINCHYLSVTCTSTPINQDSNSLQSTTLPTKIILPSKKPQKWSTGVAPGDYGGPPTTTKLRKYWGGEKEDPITSSDLIWNRDFMPHMKRLIGDSDDSSSDPRLSTVKEEPSGFLSLNRVMSLDSMEVDLSKELTTTSNPIIEKQVEAVQATETLPKKWRPAPTRREQDKWDRATKAATGGSDVMFRELRRPKGDPKVLAAKSREQYFKLKNKLQILTIGIGGVGLVSAYFTYTPEITVSYGAGLVGSLVYMRMLGNSIDGMADGARGVIKAAIGQPRLLVPVALVMIFNRWNGIVAPEYGLMNLQLIPMLVGFFTYKIATFTQAIEEAITIVGNNDAQVE
ncbi:protein CONSERVED ONLY IN THE GREEN LINEAGE 160, chloroplastic [Cynara cardunculus var. scolymus]|uniref:protein CONSERVED ONLY IN THE GREEN LINEAGE 160, chloroplastic n=1 Tax=Cynara cardunculus var. scolymus TaxID=59895 RepID=UPI000D62A85E|nr:protein CONSERVED ONLY IN THE GREEN LINEAGE 160, chloroplastic [Cynara cardunculus var. scolymus]